MPWNSSIRVLFRGRLSLEYLFTVSTVAVSISSMRATGMPDWMVWITVLTAPSSESKAQVADDHRLGDAVEAQRDLGDDAERALGADEQLHEVVARASICASGAEAHQRGRRRVTTCSASTFSRMVP